MTTNLDPEFEKLLKDVADEWKWDRHQHGEELTAIRAYVAKLHFEIRAHEQLLAVTEVHTSADVDAPTEVNTLAAENHDSADFSNVTWRDVMGVLQSIDPNSARIISAYIERRAKESSERTREWGAEIEKNARLRADNDATKP